MRPTKNAANACRLACADEFIDRFPDGYNTYIEQGGTNVSGGQKQRLCIARALLKKPKILILDDSTSAVDTATDAKIRKAFAEEIPNTTKLIIAQRISSIMNADRIIVLNNGVMDGFVPMKNSWKQMRFTAKYMNPRHREAVILMKEVQNNGRKKIMDLCVVMRADQDQMLQIRENYCCACSLTFLRTMALHVSLL